MKKLIQIQFPTRAERQRQVMKSFSKDGIKMLLCYGISLNNKKKFVCDCGDNGCANAGKHPIGSLFPKGAHNATTDLRVLVSALKKHPNANLAIAVDGFFVIDVDGPKGMEFMKTFKAPPTLRIKTGRGFHYYYQGELPEKPRKIEQIDIKINGYVMAETSRHKSGVYYKRVS